MGEVPFTLDYFPGGRSGRLTRRVPSATVVRTARLTNHSFRFHKRSTDGSAKGDALETGNPQDVVLGVIFDIDEREKPALDEAEGLGAGYVEKTARVIDEAGTEHIVSLYVAHPDYINTTLLPYSWYKRFVVDGARQHQLPVEYVAAIAAMPEVEDTDRARDRRARSIKC